MAGLPKFSHVTRAVKQSTGAFFRDHANTQASDSATRSAIVNDFFLVVCRDASHATCSSSLCARS
jgi:hypothetical protein